MAFIPHNLRLPLSLLIIALLSEYLLKQTIGSYLILVVMTSVWCLNVYRSTSPVVQPQPPEDAASSSSLAHLNDSMSGITQAATELVGATQSDMSQQRAVQADAIKGLMQSFTGIERASREQSRLVQELTSAAQHLHESSDGKDKNYLHEMLNIVQSMTDSITATGKSSVELVSVLNEIQNQIQAVEQFIGEIDSISKQTCSR